MTLVDSPLPAARLPPAAGPGDRVGVAALSGPIDPEVLERGLAELRRLGFEPVLADNAHARRGLFAGGDGERLAAFHRLAARGDLAAIFFTRGGHGLLRVLPGIDWELLRRRPRAYVGYSDLTPFLLVLVARLGLVGFHGPLVGAELARGLLEAERASLLGALAGSYPVEVELGLGLRSGIARGPLLGGCLSLLAATVGTPWFPSLAGALVLWEDVNEPPYRIDRMLTHLGLSGNLDRIAGMIVGHLDAAGTPSRPSMPGRPSTPGDIAGPAGHANPAYPAHRPDTGAAREQDTTWRAVVQESLAGYSWPLAWGLAAGHRSPNLTFPLGLEARMETTASAPVPALSEISERGAATAGGGHGGGRLTLG